MQKVNKKFLPLCKHFSLPRATFIPKKSELTLDLYSPVHLLTQTRSSIVLLLTLIGHNMVFIDGSRAVVVNLYPTYLKGN